MIIRIVRKHLLSQKAIHGLLDSLQQVVNRNAANGWRTQGGITVLNDFILLMVVNDVDDAVWMEG